MTSPTDLFREIGQTLSRNKLRTALTGFAVAWGIFMLVVLVAFSSGLSNGFEENFLQEEPKINIWGGFTSKPWHGYREGRAVELRSRDMKLLGRTDTDHITSITSTMTNDTLRWSTPSESFAGGFMGVTAGYFITGHGRKIEHGRMINEADLRQRRRSVVLRDEKAALLFGSPEAAVGRQVNGMGLAWTVVGVYSSPFDEAVYIPYTTAAALTSSTDKVNNIVVGMRGIATDHDVEQINAKVLSTLAASHDFDPSDDGAVWINNQVTQRLQSQKVMGVLVWVTWAIGLLTLLSGIVGVSNIMFVSVKERTHELGIRRAIGARRGSIISQVVMESVVITTLCGYAGIVLGTALMAVAGPAIEAMELFARPKVDIALAIETTAVLVVCGALAGLLPAIKATKVKPVEALRDE